MSSLLLTPSIRRLCTQLIWRLSFFSRWHRLMVILQWRKFLRVVIERMVSMARFWPCLGAVWWFWVVKIVVVSDKLNVLNHTNEPSNSFQIICLDGPSYQNQRHNWRIKALSFWQLEVIDDMSLRWLGNISGFSSSKAKTVAVNYSFR